MFWLALLALWLIAVISLLLIYRRDLLALWCEPVLSHPVLIVESDDWGAGPIEQAPALLRLSELLGRYRDADGHPPVMTIAVVLAIPDGAVIAASGRYQRRALGSALFHPIVEALQLGVSAQVFALQLHGLEHYWPETLMASGEAGVMRWLREGRPQSTERLPAHLQSRWLDARHLPSSPLDSVQIERAAEEEISLFSSVLGQAAKVVVPPTFVWDDNIERAWAARGIEILVTPGRRSSGRNSLGEPDCSGGGIRNGEISNGLTCIVRNDYFEPEKGHQAERALDALRLRTRQGRPCLLETHRSNFLQSSSDAAYRELDRFLSQAVASFADIRFMSTLELGRVMRDRSGPLLVQSRSGRLAAWIARLEELSRFHKLGRLSGLVLLLRLTDSLLRGREKKFSELA